MTYTTARPAIRNKARYVTAPRRRRLPKNKRLARLVAVKRALHFVGFLCYWAVALGLAYLAMLVFMVACLALS